MDYNKFSITTAATAGAAEGEQFQNEHGIETIVYDRDENGNVLGWHKELTEANNG